MATDVSVRNTGWWRDADGIFGTHRDSRHPHGRSQPGSRTQALSEWLSHKSLLAGLATGTGSLFRADRCRTRVREAGTRASPSALTSRFVWGVATVSRQSLWALLVPWRCTDPPESPPRHTTPRDGARLRDIRDRHARPRYLSAVARSRMSDHERSRGNPISAWSPPSPHLLAAPRMPPQRIGGRQGCPLEWRLVSLRGWSLALSVGLRRRSGQL